MTHWKGKGGGRAKASWEERVHTETERAHSVLEGRTKTQMKKRTKDWEGRVRSLVAKLQHVGTRVNEQILMMMHRGANPHSAETRKDEDHHTMMISLTSEIEERALSEEEGMLARMTPNEGALTAETGMRVQKTEEEKVLFGETGTKVLNAAKAKAPSEEIATRAQKTGGKVLLAEVGTEVQTTETGRVRTAERGTAAQKTDGGKACATKTTKTRTGGELSENSDISGESFRLPWNYIQI